MIDNRGYRLNVGIVLLNNHNQVFWGKRKGAPNSWQFPQGGLNNYETLKEAMYRELHEEIGLNSQDVEIVAMTRRWHYYKLPKYFLRTKENFSGTSNRICVGQKQRWFLLRILCDENKINFTETNTPEFIGWSWVDYWHPLTEVIAFKHHVYQDVLTEFSAYVKLPQS